MDGRGAGRPDDAGSSELGRVDPGQNAADAPQQLAGLGSVSRVQIYSLQKGAAAAAQLREMPQLNIIDHTAALNDFADTAALISQLDLVITVDTSVAHISGALAVETWLMLPKAPDWRWMLNRADSPWYPSMRLFRQTHRRDWSDVVEQIVTRLDRSTSSS